MTETTDHDLVRMAEVFRRRPRRSAVRGGFRDCRASDGVGLGGSLGLIAF